MTVDEDLLTQVDETVRKLNTTRSRYIRESIRFYLKQSQTRYLEQQHREGYAKNPAGDDEFSDWEEEQIWD